MCIRDRNYSIEDQNYISLNTNEYGNFGMSTILIKTAFSGGTGIVNKNFQKFRDNRLIIAERIARKNQDGTILYDEDGFPEGYNKNHQTIMVASFLSAYTGTSPNKISLNPIQSTPLPNWNLNYTGLTKIKSIGQIFNRFSISHGYRSSYCLLYTSPSPRDS